MSRHWSAWHRFRGSKSLTLAVVCIAQFMVVLDVTIVNIALPDMRHSLSLSPGGLAWVLDSYSLVFGGFMLLGGRAADLYGRKRVFLVGLGLFTVTSLLGGLAQNGAQLISARALQGLGGAVLSPGTLTLLSTTFAGQRERDRAFGLWGAVGGLGGATGVIAGGLLTGLLSWRWIFLINVPIGLVVSLVAYVCIADVLDITIGPQLDWAGALTATGGLIVLVYGVMQTATSSWGSVRVLSCLACAAVLLAVFAMIEVRHPRPLLPLHVFRSRDLSGANIVMLFGAAATFTLFFFLSQYLQDVKGYGAVRTGLAFLPMPISVIAGTQISSRLLGRLGVRTLLAVSSSLSAVGFLLLARAGVSGAYVTHVGIPGALVSLGSGMSFVPLTMSATSGVGPGDAGLASGLINTARQIGGALGLSALVTVAATRTHVGAVNERLSEATGFAAAFLVASAILVVAVVTSLVVLPRHRPRPRDDLVA